VSHDTRLLRAALPRMQLDEYELRRDEQIIKIVASRGGRGGGGGAAGGWLGCGGVCARNQCRTPAFGMDMTEWRSSCGGVGQGE
jgi:hypothetical protein